jgi:hypothetical protein
MAVFDNFREFFGKRFRRIDRQMSKESQSAAAQLKQRVNMYVEQVDADVSAHIKDMIAEEERLFNQLDSAPAPAGLAAPAKEGPEPAAAAPPSREGGEPDHDPVTGEVYPEAPAPEAPPRKANKPHVEAVNWLKDRAGAAAKSADPKKKSAKKPHKGR